MISLDTITPNGMLLDVTARVKQRRLELNLTQEGLAERAGIKLPTYRKFERTGSIAFEKLLLSSRSATTASATSRTWEPPPCSCATSPPLSSGALRLFRI